MVESRRGCIPKLTGLDLDLVTSGYLNPFKNGSRVGWQSGLQGNVVPEVFWLAPVDTRKAALSIGERADGRPKLLGLSVQFGLVESVFQVV